MVLRWKRELFPGGKYDSDDSGSESDFDMDKYSPPSSPSPEEKPMRFPDPVTPAKGAQNSIDGATRVECHQPVSGATVVNGQTPVNAHNSDSVSPPAPRHVRTLPPAGILPAAGPPLSLSKLPSWHREALGEDRCAGQELSCDYIEAQDCYFLFVQFLLGGNKASMYDGTLSPRAVFRTWRRNSDDPQPWWVKMHTGGGEYRIVTREWAIGRCFLMSRRPENTAIARDLALWAQKFHGNPSTLPAAETRWWTEIGPEDVEES